MYKCACAGLWHLQGQSSQRPSRWQACLLTALKHEPLTSWRANRACALQLSGFARPWELPLNLTKLVIHPTVSDFQLGTVMQRSDISVCVRHLRSLRHLALYGANLRVESVALFAAASGLPNLRSLHLVNGI